jgi:predicted transposase/invertase (TIGR01784 family)
VIHLFAAIYAVIISFPEGYNTRIGERRGYIDKSGDEPLIFQEINPNTRSIKPFFYVVISRMNITDHHDHFFKTIFKDKDNAIDFISGAFPNNIRSNLKLTTLKITESSFTDRKLKKHFSDVVYECETVKGEQTFITILFEHKSFVPQYPHVQLLRYFTGIWELQIKQKRELTPVIPVIVYHGGKRWIKKEFQYSFRKYGKDIFSFIPVFDYLLIDLSKLTDKEIKDELFTQSALRIGLLIQKNIFDTENLRNHLKDFLMLGRLYYREEKGLLC